MQKRPIVVVQPWNVLVEEQDSDDCTVSPYHNHAPEKGSGLVADISANNDNYIDNRNGSGSVRRISQSSRFGSDSSILVLGAGASISMNKSNKSQDKPSTSNVRSNIGHDKLQLSIPVAFPLSRPAIPSVTPSAVIRKRLNRSSNHQHHHSLLRQCPLPVSQGYLEVAKTNKESVVPRLSVESLSRPVGFRRNNEVLRMSEDNLVASTISNKSHSNKTSILQENSIKFCNKFTRRGGSKLLPEFSKIRRVTNGYLSSNQHGHLTDNDVLIKGTTQETRHNDLDILETKPKNLLIYGSTVPTSVTPYPIPPKTASDVHLQNISIPNLGKKVQCTVRNGKTLDRFTESQRRRNLSSKCGGRDPVRMCRRMKQVMPATHKDVMRAVHTRRSYRPTPTAGELDVILVAHQDMDTFLCLIG